MNARDADRPDGPRKPFWTKRRIGLLLCLIGMVPTLAVALHGAIEYYAVLGPYQRGPAAARAVLQRTWSVGKWLWPFVTAGIVVHLLGLIEEAPVKRRP